MLGARAGGEGRGREGAKEKGAVKVRGRGGANRGEVGLKDGAASGGEGPGSRFWQQYCNHLMPQTHHLATPHPHTSYAAHRPVLQMCWKEGELLCCDYCPAAMRPNSNSATPHPTLFHAFNCRCGELLCCDCSAAMQIPNNSLASTLHASPQAFSC